MNEPQTMHQTGTAAKNEAGFSYKPQPHEVAYYNSLFKKACTGLDGEVIPGRQAAHFLHRSKISLPRLKMIWSMAAKGSSMDRDAFYVAVRLVQLQQNQQTAIDVHLNTRDELVEMNPPFFEGISDVSVPLPKRCDPPTKSNDEEVEEEDEEVDFWESISSNISALTLNASEFRAPATQHGPTRQIWAPVGPSLSEEAEAASNKDGGDVEGLATTEEGNDAYFMSEEEQYFYEEAFYKHRVREDGSVHTMESSVAKMAKNACDESSTFMQGGYVYVEEAVQLFTKSGLEREKIGALWDLVVSDINAARLDNVEFVLLVHLIVCVTRRDLALPLKLPASLRKWKDRRTNPRSAVGSNDNSSKAPHIVDATPDAMLPVALPPALPPTAPGEMVASVEATPTLSNRKSSKSQAARDGSGGQTCSSCNAVAAKVDLMEVDIWQMESEIDGLKSLVQSLTEEVSALRKEVATSKTPRTDHTDRTSREDTDRVNVAGGYGGGNASHHRRGSIGSSLVSSQAEPPQDAVNHRRGSIGSSVGSSQAEPLQHPVFDTRRGRGSVASTQSPAESQMEQFDRLVKAASSPRQLRDRKSHQTRKKPFSATSMRRFSNLSRDVPAGVPTKMANGRRRKKS